MLSDLVTFFGAVISQWLAVMSSAVAVALYALSRYRDRDVEARTFAVIALVVLYFAAFLAWRTEHTTAQRLAKAAAPAVTPAPAPPAAKPGPRFLSDAQTAELAVALRGVPAPTSVELVWMEGNGECESYVQAFGRVFARVGWRVTGTTAASISPVPPSGLAVVAAPGDAAAAKLTAALVRLGIPVDPGEDANQPAGKLALIVWKRPE